MAGTGAETMASPSESVGAVPDPVLCKAADAVPGAKAGPVQFPGRVLEFAPKGAPLVERGVHAKHPKLKQRQ